LHKLFLAEGFKSKQSMFLANGNCPPEDFLKVVFVSRVSFCSGGYGGYSHGLVDNTFFQIILTQKESYSAIAYIYLL